MQQQILLLKDGTKSAGGKLPITNVATKYFADRDMFCAGQVQEEDLNRTMKASEGAITSTVHDMTSLLDPVRLLRRAPSLLPAPSS